jgi:HSP20 family molecular chaperone IbpA
MINKLNENYLNNIFNELLISKNYTPLKTNIKETKDSYIMELLVPGFTKEDIDINLKEEYLTITASKNENEEEYLLKEINNYSYRRSYYVGEVTLADIKAKLDNGILTLTINKIKEKEVINQKIEIN